MGDSVRTESQSPPEAAAGSGGRRNVRRRLVQSTLFTPNPPQVTEPTAELKEEGNLCEGEGGGECEEACGSQKGSRKRKGRAATPQKKASSGKKGKQSEDGTPTKSARKTPTKSARKLTSPVKIGDSPPPMPNLRLEAKLTAEENSRMFAGRQIHPFFSSRKPAKKSEDVSEIGGGICSIEGKKRGITLGPIHVFENTKDEERLPLDWRSWMFCENKPINSDRDLERTASFFEGSISSLTFDKFKFAKPSCNESFVENEQSFRQSPNQGRSLHETSSTDLAAEADECYSVLKNSELNHGADTVGFLSRHAENLRKVDVKQQKFHQERLLPCYVDRGSKPAEMLWTDKFRPKRAVEICGNDESVKFLGEWLHLWHERHHRNSKYLNGLDDSSSLENSNSYHLHDSDSEFTEEGERLKNVLLIIGPVGCGKSAAIYACAEEQGFDVMEVNASDCRNGALLKQRYGEALESQWLKWAPENDLDSQKGTVCNSALPDGEREHATGNEVIELIHVSDEDTSNHANGAGKISSQENGAPLERRKVKPLILFEDVDIIFLEDRGFIAAIEQIADTAKGPLILTTNDSSIALPGSLDRLEMSFAMPSLQELVLHVYMVCAAEEVLVHPHLIERLVECFKGDIRKTLMHLQFWCQGNRYNKDEVRRIGSDELFDLNSVHKILPNLMPWDFPSELSGLVEKEIAMSLSAMEENYNSVVFEEEEFEKEALDSSFVMDHTEIELEAKKEAMLSRNYSIHDDQEHMTQSVDIPCDFSKSPGTPVAFTRRNGRRKMEVVLSSDSEAETESRIPCLSTDQQNFLTPSPSKLSEDKVEMKECCLFPCSVTEAKSEIRSQWEGSVYDISCVPESTYVAETAMEDETDTVSCRTISSFPQVVETEEFFSGNGLTDNLSPKHGKSLTRLRKRSDLSGNTHHVIEQSYQNEEVSQYQYAETFERGHHVMDECSRMVFRRRSVPNVVHESWKQLRGKDLRRYVSSEEKDALRIIQVAHGMSNLMSESDLLLCKCGEVTNNYLDPRTFFSEEPEFSAWRDEQWQMTSATFQHGFCSVAKDIAAVGTDMNFDNGQQRVDLTSEILSSTRDEMALAKMILRDMKGSSFSLDGGTRQRLSTPNAEDISRRDRKSDLSDVVQSLIPPRTCLSLRGNALHEYLSSLGNISRIEASRLSQGTNTSTTKRRRGRAARHYLSTGTLMLSAEDISLLEKSTFPRNSEPQLTEANDG